MTTTFTLKPRKVGIVLGLVAVLMSVLAVIGDSVELKYDSPDARSEGNTFIWPIARQFNFVEEGNLANFYQGLQLVLASVLLFVIWRGKVQRRETFRGHWLALAIIFLFLGTDEVAQIHETTIANTIATLRHHESDKTGWFWVYVPVLAIFGAAYIPFLRHLSGKIAVLFMVSGTIYVSGAVLMEKFVNWFAGKYGDDTIGYILIDNLSEFMESTGIALFVYTLVAYLAKSGTEIRFRLGEEPGDLK